MCTQYMYVNKSSTHMSTSYIGFKFPDSNVYSSFLYNQIRIGEKEESSREGQRNVTQLNNRKMLDVS